MLSRGATCCKIFSDFFVVLFNPIRPVGGGGGGLIGPDDQTQSCQSETSYSMMRILCEF